MGQFGMYAAFLLAVAAQAAEPEWVAITPGQDLAGWRVYGGAWSVDGDEIVGLAKEGEVAFLLSEAVYADCAIEVEFRTPRPCNGGLQFRGHVLPEEPVPSEVNPEDRAWLVYGYQANVDTRKPAGTGSLVDEHGRGWLAEPSAQARSSVDPTGWNRLGVWTQGDKILLRVNGEVAVKGRDAKFTKGRVGLQVMGLDGAEPTEIRYRNLRVADFGWTGPWRPLFDGKTLEGWRNWGSEKWAVQDGAISGTRGPKQSEGYLATEETWRDFRVRGSFRLLGEGGNYGLFYHSAIGLREDGYPLIAGVQGEVAPGRPSPTGWVYESYARGWLVEPERTRAAAYAAMPDEWNEIEIESVGNRIRTWVNGVQVMDLVDEGQQLTEGSFALQLHAGEGEGILWKDLFVLDPPERPGAAAGEEER